MLVVELERPRFHLRERRIGLHGTTDGIHQQFADWSQGSMVWIGQPHGNPPALLYGVVVWDPRSKAIRHMVDEPCIGCSAGFSDGGNNASRHKISPTMKASAV